MNELSDVLIQQIQLAALHGELPQFRQSEQLLRQRVFVRQLRDFHSVRG